MEVVEQATRDLGQVNGDLGHVSERLRQGNGDIG